MSLLTGPTEKLVAIQLFSLVLSNEIYALEVPELVRIFEGTRSYISSTGGEYSPSRYENSLIGQSSGGRCTFSYLCVNSQHCSILESACFVGPQWERTPSGPSASASLPHAAACKSLIRLVSPNLPSLLHPTNIYFRCQRTIPQTTLYTLRIPFCTTTFVTATYNRPASTKMKSFASLLPALGLIAAAQAWKNETVWTTVTTDIYTTVRDPQLHQLHTPSGLQLTRGSSAQRAQLSSKAPRRILQPSRKP
jgi:hypothetical protein